MWTEKDDSEVEYGKWYCYDLKDTLAEEHKVHPPETAKGSWPRWSDGVPETLCREVRSAAFVLTGVRHRDWDHYASVKLAWNAHTNCLY